MRWTFACLVAVVMSGCAGGWREGAAPGAAAPAASATPTTSQPASGPAAEGMTTFTWSGGGSEVFLAGDFNAWNATAEKMTKQADGSFTLARSLPPGKHLYKFVVDGTWKEDPTAKETADDGMGGKNSVVVVGGAAADGAVAGGAGPASPIPSQKATSSTAAAGKATEVTAEGVRFLFSEPAQAVSVAGDWNQWAINADPMTRQPDGTWMAVKTLPPGRYAYKFVVNGTVWKKDDSNPESVDDGFGGKNSIVEVK